MNVPTVRITPDEAREQLRDVRAALHRRADTEYEAIKRGLEAVAAGALGILSLPEVLQAAAFDEKGRPRLAIARADRRQVEFRWERLSSGQALFTTRIRDNMGGDSLDRRAILQAPPEAKWGWEGRGFSLVPIIPPKVRNEVRFTDRDVFILWEVEAWADNPLRTVPDRDPYLLRHLAGDAYVILAEWDLTDLERMVMAGRRGLV